jgi:leucyl aminopeptidase
LKTDIADIKNVNNGYINRYNNNGTITGAGFLSNFLPNENIPWVHADIAAVSYNEKNTDGLFPGGTGSFFKTLLNYLMSDTNNEQPSPSQKLPTIATPSN